MTTIVFQHIPKTGGTSIVKGMQQAFGSAALSCASDSDLVVWDASELAQYSLVFGHVSTRSIEHCLPNADVLLCVREPVERVLSQYFDWRMKHAREVELDKASRYRAIVDTSLDFYDDLLRCLDDYALPTYSELRDRQAWQLGDHAFDRTKSNAEILNCAKTTIERAFIVGLHEKMEVFLATVAHSCGLGIPLPSYRLNVTEGRPRAVDIPASVRKAIERVNTLDLALYDFVRTLLERTEAHDARSSRTLVAPPRSAEPTNAKWRRPAILEDRDYRGIAGWVPDGIVEILACLFRHQRFAAPDSALLEFRPFHGQYLVALGSLLPPTAAIIGVDTSEDRAAYPDSVGCHQACVAAVQRFFGAERAKVFARKPAGKEELMKTLGAGVRMGVISRAFSALDVMEELEWLDRFLTPDGFVLVNDFLNPSWIQVNDGAMRYIGKQRGQLVPFMLCYGHLLLCRPDMSFYFRERARGIPHFYGCALLDIAGFECVKT